MDFLSNYYSKLPATRGIRNNNPFNIVRSPNAWLGKIVPSQDKRFEQFDTIEHGVRAGVLLLRNYIRKKNPIYGRSCNLSQIIPRFAPSTENHTEIYIMFLEKDIQIGRYDEIAFPSDQFNRLCCALMRYESQYVVPESHIAYIIEHYKLY